jgi:hypothetical protein
VTAVVAAAGVLVAAVVAGAGAVAAVVVAAAEEGVERFSFLWTALAKAADRGAVELKTTRLWPKDWMPGWISYCLLKDVNLFPHKNVWASSLSVRAVRAWIANDITSDDDGFHTVAAKVKTEGALPH